MWGNSEKKIECNQYFYYFRFVNIFGHRLHVKTFRMVEISFDKKTINALEKKNSEYIWIFFSIGWFFYI